jgi:hypothetical protein
VLLNAEKCFAIQKLSGRGTILEINKKPSEEKFDSGGVVYIHADRTVGQTAQSLLPFHNPHVTATMKV